ncbi:transcriptional regulator [Pseudothauera nasutitermitis]|uniref:Transcriptional regulator n=1 Tax=Pseudothauera nasutitermitis TaxID=2565930 RepID=A0A4S4B3D8_9RHOO|nr:transcriptional regulator [Pseudothauera nasutitermitis]THF67065.1 transcriptional regulator [Pseudothauera nasutitermitis]
MSNTHPCKLVVIIAEQALEGPLARDVMALGAHGYTVADVRGWGAHGARSGAWEADKSIRMEILCDEATSLAITRHVEEQYFRHYAMVAFVADVGVLRPQKFVR